MVNHERERGMKKVGERKESIKKGENGERERENRLLLKKVNSLSLHPKKRRERTETGFNGGIVLGEQVTERTKSEREREGEDDSRDERRKRERESLPFQLLFNH